MHPTLSHHLVRRSHPPSDQFPGEHTGPHPYLVHYTYFYNCIFIAATHIHTHSFQIEIRSPIPVEFGTGQASNKKVVWPVEQLTANLLTIRSTSEVQHILKTNRD